MNEKMLSIHKYIEKNNTRKTLPYDEFIRSNSLFIDLYNNDYPYKIYFRSAEHDSAKRENYYFILESHDKIKSVVKTLLLHFSVLLYQNISYCMLRLKIHSFHYSKISTYLLHLLCFQILNC